MFTHVDIPITHMHIQRYTCKMYIHEDIYDMCVYDRWERDKCVCGTYKHAHTLHVTYN